jgi:hypothetical protein
MAEKDSIEQAMAAGSERWHLQDHDVVGGTQELVGESPRVDRSFAAFRGAMTAAKEWPIGNLPQGLPPNTPPLVQIHYDLVTIGNPGNRHDTTGHGGVPYAYRIGKYDVTIGQYTAFLNAVAKTDMYGLYKPEMEIDLQVAGIRRTGASGSRAYHVVNNGGDSSSRPITYVSWFDAARFANWMSNGQPTGPQDKTTTENGAYTLNGATSAPAVAKNPANPNTGGAAPTFTLPTENEWYKAAYYSPALTGGSGGYYAYATQSDTAPGNHVCSAGNQANHPTNAGFSVTQTPAESEGRNYLTDAGAFLGSGSFYRTFDQCGNVMQWNDLVGTAGPRRGLRNGSWRVTFTPWISSRFRHEVLPTVVGNSIGFRLASPMTIQAPSTTGTSLKRLGCASSQVFGFSWQANP